MTVIVGFAFNGIKKKKKESANEQIATFIHAHGWIERTARRVYLTLGG